jgi:predicted O-methyltransferase YrrM
MQTNDVQRIIDASFDYKGRGYYADIHSVQRKSEIYALAEEVRSRNPKIIVEIGTYRGGTFFIWVRSNPNLELIISIDLPDGAFGGGYDVRRQRLYRQFLNDRIECKAEFLRTNSHDPKTFSKVSEILMGRDIDFLFIDGDHSYEGVKQDFDLYSPLVREGGLVAFHDIVTKVDAHEVYRFWDEIKNQYRYKEFIENPDGKMGIGMIDI